jgi:hypothetical protein
LCGDVEVNPGPFSGNRQDEWKGGSQWVSGGCEFNYQGDPQSRLGSFYNDMSHTLSDALQRFEATSQRQGRVIEQQILGLEQKIDKRFEQLEQNQSQLSSLVDRLSTECQALWLANKDLQKAVVNLTGKCDYLENQSRRNNLLFIGFPLAQGESESWQDCERKVEAAIRDGMGIYETIHIERAHRVGKNIIVKFLTYKQKELVIKNAKRLKDSACFYNIFVQEDYSQIVQSKRQALLSLQRELKGKGRKSKLKFDKLLVGGSVYTYDLHTQRYFKDSKWQTQRGAGHSPRGSAGQSGRDSQRASGQPSQSPLPPRQPSPGGPQRAVHVPQCRLLSPKEFPPLPTQCGDSDSRPVDIQGPLGGLGEVGTPGNLLSPSRDSDLHLSPENKLPGASGEESRGAVGGSCSEGGSVNPGRYNLRNRGLNQGQGRGYVTDCAADVGASSRATPRRFSGAGRARARGPSSPSQPCIDTLFQSTPLPGSVGDVCETQSASAENANDGVDGVCESGSAGGGGVNEGGDNEEDVRFQDAIDTGT